MYLQILQITNARLNIADALRILNVKEHNLIACYHRMIILLEILDVTPLAKLIVVEYIDTARVAMAQPQCTPAQTTIDSN